MTINLLIYLNSILDRVEQTIINYIKFIHYPRFFIVFLFNQIEENDRKNKAVEISNLN
jgi:hypothetical protein